MSKVAVVTGGTRGIGEAISLGLKDAGFTVIASYAGNDEKANAFSEANDISVAKFDVGDYAACEEALNRISETFGPVGVIVNNAGITRDAMLHKMKHEQWSAVIRTNLDSLFNMTRPVIDSMRAEGFGRIINISSINGVKGQMGQTNYSAAKAGVIGFTKALAQETARKGITVNAIAPGYINTEMVQAVPKDVLESKILPLIACGRLGEPEEISRAVVFLASDEAGWITGETININGGQYFA